MKSAGKIIFDETMRIADDLLLQAVEQDGVLYWKEYLPYAGSPVSHNFSLSIYGGSSGMALFFAALYKHTSNVRYYQALNKIVLWTEREFAKITHMSCSMYTGAMGIVFMYTRLYQMMGDNKYLDHAVRAAKRIDEAGSKDNGVDTEETKSELLDGQAGALLGWLHLYSVTGYGWVFKKIETCIHAIISKMHPGKKGVYWDRSHKQVKGLCGFSHGAAGIGFVLMETGRYFNNSALQWLSRQAFEYESMFYSKMANNWQDLRKEAVTEEENAVFEQKVLNNDKDFFARGNYMNAWCHGAAGIGLTRLRAFDITGRGKTLKEAKQALAKTYITELEQQYDKTPTLCHGTCGNADLFLEAGHTLNSKRYLKWAQEAALKVIEARGRLGIYRSGYPADTQENISLFMGNAGLGYFYLRVLSPQALPSLLLPYIETNKPAHFDRAHTFDLSLAQVQQQLISKRFPKTVEMAQLLIPAETLLCFSGQAQAVTFKTFKNFIRQQLLGFENKKHKELLNDIFKLEAKKLSLDAGIESNAFLFHRAQAVKKQNREFLKNNVQPLQDLAFELNKANLTMSCKYHWESPMASHENMDAAAGHVCVLLMPGPTGISEEWLPDFSAFVLLSFKKPATVGRVINEVLDMIQPGNEAEKQNIIDTVSKQVIAAFENGILLNRH